MTELQVVSRILNQKSMNIVTENNITDDYFISYKSEYEYIKNHVEKYGNVPDKETFLSVFPDFQVVDVSETDKFLVNTFNEECQRQLGSSDTFNPSNLIETKKFEMVTPEVKISVDPEYAYRITTRIIDGEKYILIPADGSVEVNGIEVSIEE